MPVAGALLGILGLFLALSVVAIGVVYVLVPMFRGIGWLVRHLLRFVFGEIGDALRLAGALLTQLVLVPLVVANVFIGRWSAVAHFGRAVQAEFGAAGAAAYRIAIGHPARLCGLTALTDGIERRVPEVIAAAPGPDRPARAGQFRGYRIVGSLAGGGSGSRLYIAEPDVMKRATLERGGQHGVGRVVIKSFSLHDGSSLPQIVRESRSLDAAKRLGLVLEHELSDERFFYVMRYVPGDSLALVTQRLHADSGREGLGDAQLARAMGYAADLLGTLQTYHRGGLWHKDVKPDNIIVDGRRAHLVDFGLVTPLRSAMTLTTHGTEYFRDPELVRLALRGVKVHQVDGAKFDVYAAAAVLYSVIENSFPAHGGLSQITRRCPEALRWIVRRGMAEYDRRYDTASQMLADLEVVRSAPDPFAVKPVELPSMGGAPVQSAPSSEFRVPSGGPIAHCPLPIALPPPRATAKEQLASARERAHAARRRARERMGGHTRRHSAGLRTFNAGVAASLFLFLAACILIAGAMLVHGAKRQSVRIATHDAERGSLSFAQGVLPAPGAPPAGGLHASNGRGGRVTAARQRSGAPRPLPTPGTVLVISDAAPPFAPAAAASMESAFAGLRAAGFTLIGSSFAEGQDQSRAAQVQRLAAEARMVVGLAPLDSGEAGRDLGEWLAADGSADLLLWLGRAERADALTYVLFSPLRAGRPLPESRERLNAALGVLRGSR